MPLKTFRGPAAAPLLAQVQAALGPEAVVLSTGQVDGMLEIVAADPETAAIVSRMMRTGAPPRPAASRAAAPTGSPAPRPSVLAFTGPTGAGKTTTVAKLAAHPRAFAGRRVGLLCLDTYRVGALEQLGAHAELAGLPLEAVYQADELGGALERLRHCDIILADCPGRGPRLQRDADSVRELLRRIGVDETHLVLPAGLQAPVARRLIEDQLRRGPVYLLATKVDEVPDDWTLFELAAELGLPMRWLADGQRVPQDVRAATARLEAATVSLRSRQRRRQEVVA